jgi:hypothetical protein
MDISIIALIIAIIALLIVLLKKPAASATPVAPVEKYRYLGGGTCMYDGEMGPC